jgi:hypothetical protein
VLLIHQPTSYPRERAYILGVVLGEFLGLEWQARAETRSDIEITLPELSGESSLVIADRLFATPERLWCKQESLPGRPLARWHLGEAPIAPKLVSPEVPVVYGERLANGSFYEQTNDHARLGVDIFGSIFFQLTRYEELVCSTRDEHGRFPAAASLAHAEGFLSRPLANEYVEILWTALAGLWPRLVRCERSSSERLSHDVDWPLHPALSAARAARAALGDVVRRHDGGMALTRLKAMRARRHADHRADPYNTFDFIMDLSERRGLRSAFYFMSGRTDTRFDGTYSLEDPWIGALIRRIHERGHELGLHPSYATFRDPEAICAERDALLQRCERLGVEQAQWGGRQHFLRWENPTTWRGWEQAGLAYDSSLGFSMNPGFRCGTCFEYPAFDLLSRRRMGLRERPLVAMEMGLFDDPAGADREGLDTIAELRRRCELFGGDLTLLWHNSRLASRRERGLYTATLAQ